MKTKNIILAALLTAMPAAMTAQENIQKAFNALRKSKNQQEVLSRYNVEKNPETGKMEGMSDVYEFAILNAQGKQLVSAIRDAFRKDEPKAYNVSTGTHGGASNYTALAVGNGNIGGVAIGLMEGSQYIYACFLDPDDEERNHRYAYALEWVENNGKITGQIVKTYATTQKFRKSKTIASVITVNGDKINMNGQEFSLGNGFPFNGSMVFSSDSLSLDYKQGSDVWLGQFNTYKNLLLKNPDGVTASTYATRIYNLCKKADALDDDEKELVADELKRMKTKTDDELIQKLFDMSIERLKK